MTRRATRAPPPALRAASIGIRLGTRNACAALALLLLALPGFSLAADTDDDPAATALDPDYAAGKAAVEAKQWSVAIKRLSSAALRDTRNADIQNYLGYAHRNNGQMKLAFDHYGKALKLNPRHRGAHEYAGEAWLMMGNFARAEEHLRALEAICHIPCEEYGELKEKIEAYRAGRRK